MVSESAIAGRELDRKLKPPARSELAATAAALTATLGLAATAWVVAVRQMNAMGPDTATRLGSFAFFVTVWYPTGSHVSGLGNVYGDVKIARLVLSELITTRITGNSANAVYSSSAAWALASLTCLFSCARLIAINILKLYFHF